MLVFCDLIVECEVLYAWNVQRIALHFAVSANSISFRHTNHEKKRILNPSQSNVRRSQFLRVRLFYANFFCCGCCLAMLFDSPSFSYGTRYSAGTVPQLPLPLLLVPWLPPLNPSTCTLGRTVYTLLSIVVREQKHRVRVRMYERTPDRLSAMCLYGRMAGWLARWLAGWSYIEACWLYR